MTRKSVRLLPPAGVTFLLAAAAFGSADPPLPHVLAVQVVYGEAAGSVSVREEVGHALLEGLREMGCFEEVWLDRPQEVHQADLLLRVTLDELREETQYEGSIAQITSPDAEPSTKLRVVAIFSARVRVDFLSLPEESPIRSSRFLQEARERPSFLGDDPRKRARAKGMEELASRARRTACKGSRRKLQRLIEAARSSTAKSETQPR